MVLAWYWRGIGVVLLSSVVQAEWVGNHLGPELRGAGLQRTKVFVLDDIRLALPLWLEEVSVARIMCSEVSEARIMRREVSVARILYTER